jgi:hypothetical protein
MLTVTYLYIRRLAEWLKQHTELHATNELHKRVQRTKLRHKQGRKNEWEKRKE